MIGWCKICSIREICESAAEILSRDHGAHIFGSLIAILMNGEKAINLNVMR